MAAISSWANYCTYGYKLNLNTLYYPNSVIHMPQLKNALNLPKLSEVKWS